MTTAPCEWPLPEPVEDSACPPCAALENLTETERERFERMAIELLWAWSGRRFGLCEVAVRPCRAECNRVGSTMFGDGSPYLPSTGWRPALLDGQWFNIGCGVCGPHCICAPSARTAIELPGPVAAIESVWIDGAELDESSYSFKNGILYRTDGGSWPTCNDQAGDITDPDSGAWEITYQRGLAVPIGGQIAAYRLACELAKAACGDNTCELPSRVQSVTRQGVSMEITQTTFAEMKDGRTGIWTIDTWVASVTSNIIAMPGVFSPDIERDRGIGTMQGLGRGRTR